jgi:hypothetical protein
MNRTDLSVNLLDVSISQIYASLDITDASVNKLDLSMSIIDVSLDLTDASVNELKTRLTQYSYSGTTTTIEQNVTLANSTSIVTILGDSSFNGNLFVGSDVSFGSKLYVASDASMGGKLLVSGDASLNSKLYVSSDASFNNKFSVGSDVSFGGKLYTSGDASFNSKLSVGSDVSLVGKLYVANDASFIQTVSLRSVINSVSVISSPSTSPVTLSFPLYNVYLITDSSATNVTINLPTLPSSGYDSYVVTFRRTVGTLSSTMTFVSSQGLLIYPSTSTIVLGGNATAAASYTFDVQGTNNDHVNTVTMVGHNNTTTSGWFQIN